MNIKIGDFVSSIDKDIVFNLFVLKVYESTFLGLILNKNELTKDLFYNDQFEKITDKEVINDLKRVMDNK
jgi:hypothetical protein